jgi:hypothetical protein
MKQFPATGRFFRPANQAAAALLIATGLLMTSSAVRPHAASADDLGAPTLLNVTLEGSDALVSFRDNSSLEIGYNVYAFNPSDYTLDKRVRTTAVPGQGRVKTATVGGLQPNVRYCFQAAAIGDDNVTDSPRSNQICVDPSAPATAPATPDTQPPPSPVQTKAGNSSFCVACSGASIIGMPSNFRGQRDSLGTRVILTWDPVSAATFFQLRAVSHQNPGAALGVGAGADDIGAAKATITINGKVMTGFIADGTATYAAGGADYYLRACSAPGVCGGEAMVTVAAS